MISVNLIGTGRVGETMLRCLAATEGYDVQDVSNRNPEKAARAVADVGAGRAVAIDAMRPAGLWLLAVPDGEIARAAKVVADYHAPSVAVHFSGFHAACEMAALGDNGWQLASAHPNLSFADPSQAARRIPGTYVGLEGDDAAVGPAEDLFAALGAKTFRVRSDRKVLYHAAAVFSNNFSTVLQAIAQEAWAESGVPEDVARALGDALLAAAAENVARLGPAEALTGPAARGDADVVETETRAVSQWNPAVGRAYADLSAMAAQLKATGRPF